MHGRWLESNLYSLLYFPTKFGICKSFNLLDAHDLFHGDFHGDTVTKIFKLLVEKSISYNYYAVREFKSDPFNGSKPYRTTHKELGVDGIIYGYNLRNVSDGPAPAIKPYRLIIHKSHELPSEMSPQYLFQEGEKFSILVTPEMSTIDESLIKLKPEEFEEEFTVNE